MFGSSKNGSGPVTPSKSEFLEVGRPSRVQEPIGADDIPPMPGDGPHPADLLFAKTAALKKAATVERAKQAAQQDRSTHLEIGARIRLKGEIAECDVMRVEGVFEGLVRARQLVLCPGGTFLGKAEVEEAEINGSFEGALNVHGRLFVRNSGRVRGTFSYGVLEIERGGEIDGRISPLEKGAEAAAKSVEVAAPKPAPALKIPAVPAAAQPRSPESMVAAAVLRASAPGMNGVSRPVNGAQVSATPAE